VVSAMRPSAPVKSKGKSEQADAGGATQALMTQARVSSRPPRRDGALPNHPTLRLLLAGFTVLGSWSLIHTIFALHYAISSMACRKEG